MDNIFTSTTLANVFKALGAKTSDNNYAIPLFNKTSAVPQGLMDLPTLASVLGGFAKHDKDFGDSSLAEYKSTRSFLIGSAELTDSAKWTDIPQRVFSYVVVINFGLENCIQYVFNEAATFYYRNYNGGSHLWSSWKKVTAVIM